MNTFSDPRLERAKDPRNLEILKTRVEKFDARPRARVGDFLRLPALHPRLPSWTRFTHDWGDHIQTGGTENGSYYLGSGYLSYSGSLNPGVAHADLLATTEQKEGRLWFFDHNDARADGGVEFVIPLRVFELRPGAKIDGLYELHCPFYLHVWEPKEPRDYRFRIVKHAYSHVAFHLEHELHAWLRSEGLELTALANQSQRLRFEGMKEWA
ncbi:MAG TPA: hypothetical protein VFU31_21220 [Candidatus Binatia bacterium]|nr:hypothetical protein [Candidatus Binatia bacterium]